MVALDVVVEPVSEPVELVTLNIADEAVRLLVLFTTLLGVTKR